MRYVVAVKSPVYGSQGSALAYQFIKTLLENNYSISQVFFFQEGISNANKLVNPATDEINLVEKWQYLATSYRLSLHLCIAAAQRRGVVDETTTPLHTQTNLAEGFVLAGLGEFSQAVLTADRLVTF
ncbi:MULTISPECIES: sulfurtransferase complex subunit TusD [Pasteurellaceae]|uniref:Sulfurtransferase complex subunit TusD n=1 Tax=Pasteurella atlantica TaxID=2827233 RepID=A0AAW8CQC4_9PAST|nr:sulfurtransferase complex subunit TusD [Pasteurella atlantica]MBR0573571.1 sulfurtransferase complex subunit TusD [Pasteurella atlantica]MDP8039567.1 sulfurtransferase complex subunit TusD [Pasteurella atlantica]MDP8041659.1 sulfurtransferase complex subunit TusD [Pasteurella atlantica]MDP8043795.1 sulfurtransferase complex subunit TusD [Pasteurella atlantica]MDP8045879.1 sulfurtransferase complex subunit TusD [Pasteurella atlantica]